MGNRIKWIVYKNKRILFHDYSGIRGFQGEGEQLAQEVNEFVEKLTEYNILELVDVRNSFGDLESVKRLKEISKRLKPRIKKSAVIGVSGIKKVILDAINTFSERKIKPFKTEEEAKEWLILED
ncbi:MAG: STAS/SEC14 domain-containing protein [Candidatus Omnitrophota bacterium]